MTKPAKWWPLFININDATARFVAFLTQSGLYMAIVDLP